MINYNREISTSFQEYNDKYDELLKVYLNKHEDFSEIYFVEQEFEFYNKCYYSANITESSDEAGNLFYSVNNGNIRGLIAEIYESLRDSTSKANDGWDLERSNIYKATFKRIINFLELKLNTLKVKNQNLKNQISPEASDSLNKKIAAKWYALLYLLEVEIKGLKIPVNREGAFIKTEIEEIGKIRVGDGGQSFYRNVKNLVTIVKAKSDLKPYLGENWKKEIIALSENNPEIISYINKYY
jgi:hypothetical protein